jgi:hypothetical protein
MTRRRLLRIMRIAQLVLAAAGTFLLVNGWIALGAVALGVGAAAIIVSNTDWYERIYFDGPSARTHHARSRRVRTSLRSSCGASASPRRARSVRRRERLGRRAPGASPVGPGRAAGPFQLP